MKQKKKKKEKSNVDQSARINLSNSVYQLELDRAVKVFFFRLFINQQQQVLGETRISCSSSCSLERLDKKMLYGKFHLYAFIGRTPGKLASTSYTYLT